MGARLLAAVDCLDALASDRQYRPALPLEEALEEVVKLSGKSYDPQVVELLIKHYKELEELARSTSYVHEKLSTSLKVERGAAPASGYEVGVTEPEGQTTAFLSSIVAAREEARTLFELSHALGNSLRLSETLSVLSGRL